MRKIFNYILAGSFVFGAISCNEDELLDDWLATNPPAEEVVITGDPGSLDLSNYVALGNSLTAGYMDGALYNAGQASSYVNQLAMQMAYAGAGSFNQPDINSVYGYNSTFTVGENIAGRSYLDLSIPGPNAGYNGEVPTAYSGVKAELNNFGVPGARLSHLGAAGYGLANPLFGRFAVDPGTSSILGDAMATTPSFFSLWIGANDYLGYAIAGGTSATTPLEDYSQASFQADLGTVLGTLTSGGAEGVVLTLPPVVTLPLFQAVRWNAIALPEANATALNSALAAVNGGIQAVNSAGCGCDVSNRLISYAAGNNPILVVDNELEDLGPYWDILVGAEAMTPTQRLQLEPYRQSRPLVAGELVILSAAAKLGKEADGDNSTLNTPIGVAVPLGFDLINFEQEAGNGDKYFLNVAEQTAIVTARATYNGTISGVVAALNGGGADIALVDVQPTFVDMLGLDVATAGALALPTGSADGVKGLSVGGFQLQPDFSPNGVISTDAVHPNARGHAIISNLVIDAINARWGASIPKVDVISQLGVPLTED